MSFSYKQQNYISLSFSIENKFQCVLCNHPLSTIKYGGMRMCTRLIRYC